jgi:hypothetical protein
MSFCLPCNGGSSSSSSSSDSGSGSGLARKVCVRCFTFWILVALLALGVLAHHHDSKGYVRF